MRRQGLWFDQELSGYGRPWDRSVHSIQIESNGCWERALRKGAQNLGRGTLEKEILSVPVLPGRVRDELSPAEQCRNRVLDDQKEIWQRSAQQVRKRDAERGAVQDHLSQHLLHHPRDV